MSTEQILPREERTLRSPRPAGEPGRPDPPDPLAKITLTPRGFAAVMATAALLIGLLLALLPVRVANADLANPTRVSCGNTVGGAEADSIAQGLGQVDRQTLVTYVDLCERSIADRTFFAWPLFFGGGLGIIWLGVVRRRP
jgi:hypothetical protein